MILGCNTSATVTLAPRRAQVRSRVFLACLVAIVNCVVSVPRATAQEPANPTSTPTPPADAHQPRRGATIGTFLLGGAAAFGLHEAGHLAFDAALGVPPEVRVVHFGPIPFFAVSHRAGLSPREEFAISSAGFWMQHLSSEIILSRDPDVAHQHAPFRKGMLAFNVFASVAYGAAAMAKAGPFERDTRAMADSLGVSERWIGALVLAPAVLDAWRYLHPESKWAAWVSRGVKVGGVLLVVH